MITAIFPRVRPTGGLARFVLQSAVLIVAFMAANPSAATTVKTLGGGTSGKYYGYVNGNTLEDALFHTPIGIAVNASDDTVFVADRDNNAIRGLNLISGDTYTFVTNKISRPVGVALDGFGNVYVLNRGTTNTVSTTGTVLTFDTYGDLIATNATGLTNAAGIALDAAGNIYVTVRSNLLIRITGATKTTVATVAGAGALLQGIVVQPDGIIAACDYGRDGILFINPNTGLVTTNTGFNGQGDYTGADNVGATPATAQFSHPFGIASDGGGSLIVCDFGNDRVKVVTASGITTNLYGVSSNDWVSPYPGWVDGTVSVPDEKGGVAGRCPAGVALSLDGTTVYTTEDYYHIVRQTTGGGFEALPPPPPAPPTGLTATVVTNSGVVVGVALTWNASENATSYNVYRSTSSGGPYTIIATNITTTSYTDTSGIPGTTYYYVVTALNGSSQSGYSSQVGPITVPIPPPPPPIIGWYDFVGNTETGFYSSINPVSPGNPYIANNPLLIAIDPNTNGVATYYITIPPYTNNTPLTVVTNFGSTPPVYENNQLYGSPYVNPLPPLSLSNGLVTIEAANVNGVGEASAVTSASFLFEVGRPTITGNDAAEFTLSDVTTNVIYYYTTDGTDPLTNTPPSQQVVSTNGNPVNLSLSISTNITFQVRAFGYGPDADYLVSGIAQQPFSFSPAFYQPNQITWGFAAGECSSAFIGAAGQTFYAPVTLTMTPPGTPVYSLQFNMTVSSVGVGVTNPAPAAGPFNFQSMMAQPGMATNTSLTVYSPIPPWMFAAYETNALPPSDYVTNSGGQVFVNLEVSNGNELAVGWLERYGFTNLYDTLSQDLIQYSIAHDDLFPNLSLGEPYGVIVGGYSFQVSPGATNGQQYQIQIGAASATDDGVGAPGSAVFIQTPTNGTLGAGSLNATKNVTIGSIPYLVGNVYPFRWFNAGDFGNSNLQSADVEQVFEAAVYDWNIPPYNPASGNGLGGYTNVSDMYDAMDSSGYIGVQDQNASDPLFGYYTNSYQTPSFSDITNLNQVAFGDGQLDVADVYVTFLRSEFTNNSLIWFQRLWTNGVRVAIPVNPSTLVSSAVLAQPSLGGGKILPALSNPAPVSITNTPFVNFTTTDFLASANQTLQIPINASIFGPYPLRMLMLNISIVPLDGSPALTVPVQFTPNPALNAALGSAAPWDSLSSGNGNYSAVWMPSTSGSLLQLPGLTNTANIGTLTVIIPTNATSLSSYAIHFDHASASPSGLVSFPRRTFTDLITLSSRTTSYYNDGIPDSWRLRYFGTIYNELSVSNADADGTGMNNWQKYIAGLNPLDPTSILNEGTDQPMAQSRQDLVLYWPSVSGQTYVIERSPTLFPPIWTPISTNIGDGSYMEIHDTSGGDNRFYQVTTP